MNGWNVIYNRRTERKKEKIVRCFVAVWLHVTIAINRHVPDDIHLLFLMICFQKVNKMYQRWTSSFARLRLQTIQNWTNAKRKANKLLLMVDIVECVFFLQQNPAIWRKLFYFFGPICLFPSLCRLQAVLLCL